MGTAHRKTSSASGWQILARQMTSTEEPCDYDPYLEYKSSSGKEPEGGSHYMWNTSNYLLHFGRAWRKILHNKSFCFVFQEKTLPISILKITLKTGRENWSHGGRGRKATFSTKRTKYQAFAIPRGHPLSLRFLVSSSSQRLCYSFLPAH